MLRRATAVVFMLVLTPALVRAQETVLKVSVQSADVHKGPSVVTPVVGQAPHGTALTVSQNLGSWVKVPVEPVRPLKKPVSLAQIKAEPRLAKMELIRQSRLSVAPVRDEEWKLVLEMAT